MYSTSKKTADLGIEPQPGAGDLGSPTSQTQRKLFAFRLQCYRQAQSVGLRIPELSEQGNRRMPWLVRVLLVRYSLRPILRWVWLIAHLSLVPH